MICAERYVHGAALTFDSLNIYELIENDILYASITQQRLFVVE